MSGYSYTTISMGPGESARVGVHVYPDAHARVNYFPTKNDGHTVLSIDYDATMITIGTTGRTVVTDDHVKFARDLLDAAARFLADCERLRDQQAEQATDQAPGAAA